MGLWNPDYRFTIWTYLPVRRRLATWMAWLRAMCSPVSDFVSPAFQTFRNMVLYFLAHNSQVTYMQAVLNDRFDNAARRIFISDPPYIDPVYIYQASENKPVYMWQASEVTGGTPGAAPFYVFQASECYSGGGTQFIVNVPAIVYAGLDPKELKALINKYRLASKSTYLIVTF